ncbi:hypothetical protein HID58_028987 [Brassica napus]|uniref:UBX domain-containing protein n=1 Tax=Brassica napus TaxID=3708 RepID=A0ABQ8CDW0_BRANA|nr:hypothetical protein HID58_028987 [Brassica napus]
MHGGYPRPQLKSANRSHGLLHPECCFSRRLGPVSMPLRLCLPSGPPTTPCCISSFVRGSVSPPLTHYTMQLQIYFPSLSGVWQWWLSLLDLLCSEKIFGDPKVVNKYQLQDCRRISPSYAPVGALGSRWTKAGVMSLSPCVQRSFSGLYHPSLMSIADETAEGLFVGFDGAGEGVNSEEEEARWRAKREAAEREVARVRMRQDLITNFPRTVYGRDKESMSLKDAGLHPQASLFIEIN